jgi:hypothetical protein
MAKENDIEDLLGNSPTPKAKAKPAAKSAAPKAKPAKEAAAPKAKPAAPKAKSAAPKAKRVKEPVMFAEGEQAEIAKKAKKIIAKGEINSRDLAGKLGVETRKLRPVLYMMSRAGDVVLEPGASRVQGMQVFPAA